MVKLSPLTYEKVGNTINGVGYTLLDDEFAQEDCDICEHETIQGLSRGWHWYLCKYHATEVGLLW